MLDAGSLFDLSKTVAGEIFKNTKYSWQALPKIQEFIQFLNTSLPDDFERISEHVWIGKGTRIEKTALIKGPAIIGYDCEIRHAAFVREFVITGNNVTVGNSTEIKNAILFDGVQVPHFNYVGDSILGYKAHLGASTILSNFKSTKDEITVKNDNGERIKTGLTKFGAMLGDFSEVGCNSVLNPGTIIGKNSTIYPLTSVRGTVPENHIVKREGEMILKNKAL